MTEPKVWFWFSLVYDQTQSFGFGFAEPIIYALTQRLNRKGLSETAVMLCKLNKSL